MIKIKPFKLCGQVSSLLTKVNLVMQSIKLYNPFLVSDQELHATIVIPVYLFGMCMDFIF